MLPVDIADAFAKYKTAVAQHRAAAGADGTDTTLTLHNFNVAKATLSTILRPLAEAERQKNSTLYWDHLTEPFRCIMTKQEQKNHKKALKKRQKAILSGETKTPESDTADTPPCTKVLLITSSNRGIELSRSRQAASRLVQALEACTTIKLTHRDVAATQPSNIDALFVKAQFNKKRNNGSYPEEVARMKESDMLCDELKKCDVLIISTGMYNFSVPACLKQWIDHVVRSKTNFYYEHRLWYNRERTLEKMATFEREETHLAKSSCSGHARACGGAPAKLSLDTLGFHLGTRT